MGFFDALSVSATETIAGDGLRGVGCAEDFGWPTGRTGALEGPP